MPVFRPTPTRVAAIAAAFMRISVRSTIVLLAAFWAVVVFASMSFAQQAILQAGPWAPNRVPMYLADGYSAPIVGDSGPAGGDANNMGISELLMTQRSPTGTYPAADTGTGISGTNFCDYDAPLTNPTGYHFLCWGPNSLGGGLLTYGAANGATQLPFQMIINGVPFSFPGTGTGNVSGPGSSTVGDIATFANTAGTLLSDSGKTLPSGAIVGTTDTQTLTNKSLVSPLITSPSINGTVTIGGVVQTFPASGQIVGTTDTQTLTNKSIDASEINSGTLTASRMPAFTGDVTTSAGSTVTSIKPSVALTGTPTAPTPAGCTSSTNIATLASVGNCQPYYDARQAGITCDGTTNIAPLLSTAITNAAGRRIILPAGTCVISSAFTSTAANWSLVGQGNSTILSITGTGYTPISVGTSGTPTSNVEFSNMTVNVAGGFTGTVFSFVRANIISMHDMIFNGNSSTSTFITYSGSDPVIAYFQRLRFSSGSIGLQIGGVATTDFPQDIWISDTNNSNMSNSCFFLVSGGGINISNNDCVLSNTGLRIQTSSSNTQGISGVQLVANWWDTNTGNGVLVTGTGLIRDVQASNEWYVNNGSSAPASAYGLALNSTQILGWQESNCHVFFNQGSGVLIGGGQFITFTACTFQNNNQANTTGTPAGLFINAGSHIQVVGGQAGPGSLGSNLQKYGVIVGGSSDYVIVQGMDVFGNVTGGILNVTSGTHLQIGSTTSGGAAQTNLQ